MATGIEALPTISEYQANNIYFLNAPEDVIGEGGQGKVSYGAAIIGDKIQEVAIKENFNNWLPANEFFKWLKTLLGTEFTLENINSIDLLKKLSKLTQENEYLPNTEWFDVAPFAEAIAAYTAYDILYPLFGKNTRIWPVSHLIIDSHQDFLGNEYIKPLTVYPLIDAPHLRLSEWVLTKCLEAATLDQALFCIADVVMQAAELFKQLEVLHANNIIHRDITPNNLLMVDGRLILTDFGIATVAKPSAYEVGGTLGFVAPDAYQTSGWSGSSDQFNIFASLLQMLLLMLKFENRGFLKRHFAGLSMDQVMGNGKTEQIEELHREIFVAIHERLPHALDSEVNYMEHLFALGLNVDSQRRHIKPVEALERLGKILQMIAMRHYKESTPMVGLEVSYDEKPPTMMAATV